MKIKWDTDKEESVYAETHIVCRISPTRANALPLQNWEPRYKSGLWFSNLRNTTSIAGAKREILNTIYKQISNTTPSASTLNDQVILRNEIWERAKEELSLSFRLEVLQDTPGTYMWRIIHNMDSVYTSSKQCATLQQGMRHCLIELLGMLRFAKSNIEP